MSLASLLVIPEDPIAQSVFAFEHDQHHQQLALNITPSDFLNLPYFVYPQMLPSGGYRMDHQQGHSDMRFYLPVMWGWYQIGTQEYGIGSVHNLQDIYDLERLQWWTFVNFQDHMTAQVVLPLV